LKKGETTHHNWKPDKNFLLREDRKGKDMRVKKRSADSYRDFTSPKEEGEGGDFSLNILIELERRGKKEENSSRFREGERAFETAWSGFGKKEKERGELRREGKDGEQCTGGEEGRVGAYKSRQGSSDHAGKKGKWGENNLTLERNKPDPRKKDILDPYQRRPRPVLTIFKGGRDDSIRRKKGEKGHQMLKGREEKGDHFRSVGGE